MGPLPSHEQRRRVLQQGLHGLDQAGGFVAVDDAVVEAGGEVHDLPRHEPARLVIARQVMRRAPEAGLRL